MGDKISDKIDAMQVPAGYTVAAGLTSTPVWMVQITTWFEFAAIFFGVLVGITTVWLNIVKIRKIKQGKKDGL